MCFKLNTLTVKTIVKEQTKCTYFMFNLKHCLKGTENSLILRTINLLLSLFLTDLKLRIPNHSSGSTESHSTHIGLGLSFELVKFKRNKLVFSCGTL